MPFIKYIDCFVNVVSVDHNSMFWKEMFDKLRFNFHVLFTVRINEKVCFSNNNSINFGISLSCVIFYRTYRGFYCSNSCVSLSVNFRYLQTSACFEHLNTRYRIQ